MINGKDDGMRDYDRWLNDSVAYERFSDGPEPEHEITDAEDNEASEKFYREKYGE